MPGELPDGAEKWARYQRFVGLALDSMTIDHIRELVWEMEEELKTAGQG